MYYGKSVVKSDSTAFGDEMYHRGLSMKSPMVNVTGVWW